LKSPPTHPGRRTRPPRSYVETLHCVVIPHAGEVFYFHRMQGFRVMPSFHVNCCALAAHKYLQASESLE